MSDAQLNLEDFVNKSVDELTSILADEPQDLNKVELKDVKKHLKSGVFTEELIKVGNELTLAPDVVVKITKVLPSTNRVFFKFDDKEFSVTKDSLVGNKFKSLYQINDEVLYLPTNELGRVVGIIESSNRYRVEFDNKTQKVVPASKLQPISNI